MTSDVDRRRQAPLRQLRRVPQPDREARDQGARSRAGSSTPILCLARGGMRPGDMLSRIFDKPLAIMSTSSYRAEAGTMQGHLDIAHYITTPKGEIAGGAAGRRPGRFGRTLHAVVDMLRSMPRSPSCAAR